MPKKHKKEKHRHPPEGGELSPPAFYFYLKVLRFWSDESNLFDGDELIHVVLSHAALSAENIIMIQERSEDERRVTQIIIAWKKRNWYHPFKSDTTGVEIQLFTFDFWRFSFFKFVLGSTRAHCISLFYLKSCKPRWKNTIWLILWLSFTEVLTDDKLKCHHTDISHPREGLTGH